MKTIEEKSSEYMSTVTCAETDNLGAKHIAKRAFMSGAQEAESWVHVANELPPETGWYNAPYILRTRSEYLIVGFTDGNFHLKGGLCINAGCAIEWRPIQRR